MPTRGILRQKNYGIKGYYARIKKCSQFVPKLDIPEHLLSEKAKLNIKAIYSVKDFNVSEFNVFGNYVIEFPNSKFIDIDVIPNNIDSIIRILT